MASLLPVGRPGGINSGFDGVPAGSGTVRLGRQLVHLDAASYRLWRTAAAAPERNRFVAWARSEGSTDAERRLIDLESEGLLLEESPAMHLQVGNLTVTLIGECLGNGEEPTPKFAVIGRNNRPVMVTPYVYEILLRSDGATSIAAICAVVESAWPADAGTTCLEAFCRVLPHLVRNEILILDAA